MSSNKSKMGRASKWLRKWFPSSATSLFYTVVFWVVLFALIFWICGLILTGQVCWFTGQISVEEPDDFFELVTVLLAIVGGIIVISYLVIKYRERAGQEREELSLEVQQISQDFLAATGQLGHDKEAVRLAGVYALVDISDRHGGLYNQRVVEVLCGYLRSDRTSTNDRAVESTIFRVIRQRTRKKDVLHHDDTAALQRAAPNTQLWCDCSFDLSGATFVEPVMLHGSQFRGEMDFGKATFRSKCSFRGTEFYSRVNFAGTTFHSSGAFDGAKFKVWCDFSNATFLQEATFVWSIFDAKVTYEAATFYGQASFKHATFYDLADFGHAEFFALSNFYEATFGNWSWSVLFDWSKFHGETVFDVAKFQGQARFTEATFHQAISFTDCRFAIPPKFYGAKFNPEYEKQIVFTGDIKRTDWLPKGALSMTTEDDVST